MTDEYGLFKQLKDSGIREDDTVTVHISLKAVGKIESEKTGADAVLDALLAAVPRGLLLIPSHTWANVRETPVYDVRNTMPCIGTLPKIAVLRANAAVDRKDPTCIRSMHPAHSVVAFGKDAVSYTEDDKRAETPMPAFGSYRKLCQRHAKILLVGVTQVNNTFIHAVDEYMQPDGISAPYPVTAIDYEGNAVVRRVCNCHGPSHENDRYMPVLREAGAVTFGKLGEAEVMVCDARKTFDAIASVWHAFNPR
ncbi:MAG: AAC(3) family N-acetyltransferase [Clostridia bacterium]|nr:AAC(3) family N-acetyltransferase [Clostridia bacterium]